jgi:hypothetical protein
VYRWQLNTDPCPLPSQSSIHLHDLRLLRWAESVLHIFKTTITPSRSGFNVNNFLSITFGFPKKTYREMTTSAEEFIPPDPPFHLRLNPETLLSLPYKHSDIMKTISLVTALDSATLAHSRSHLPII